MRERETRARLLAWCWRRLVGGNFARAVERHAEAADSLDKALREVLER